MRKMVSVLVAVLLGVGLIMGAYPAFCEDEEFCPMGGTMIKVAVNKDKAIDWAKEQSKVKITGEDSDAWSVLFLSRTNNDIAVLLTPEYVFFGVAGKGDREVDERVAKKTFGNDLSDLKETVKKILGDLWQEKVVKLEGNEVQALSDVAGLGILEKSDSGWELKTKTCESKDLDTSEL